MCTVENGFLSIRKNSLNSAHKNTLQKNEGIKLLVHVHKKNYYYQINLNRVNLFNVSLNYQEFFFCVIKSLKILTHCCEIENSNNTLQSASGNRQVLLASRSINPLDIRQLGCPQVICTHLYILISCLINNNKGYLRLLIYFFEI